MSTDAQWLDAMPAIYDRYLGPALFAPWATVVAAAAARERPRRILELAAGTGILTAALVAATEAEVVATDLNPAMVAWGAEHVPEATWRQADALRVDEPDGSFDVVACQFGVMFLPDRIAGFAEFARLLPPGGTLLCTTWDSYDTQPLANALVDTLSEIFPDDPPGFVVRTPHGYADPERIVADTRAGGFTDVTIERKDPRGAIADVRDTARGFCLGTPLRFELERRGDLEELTERVSAGMVGRLGPGPTEGVVPAYLVSARHSA